MEQKSNRLLILDVEQKKIGIRFKQIRKSMGYSSHESFAYDYNLDRAQYGKIEAGSSNMTLKVLIKHLNAIGYSLSEFFDQKYYEISDAQNE
ncbi:helix-turn-helix domain-containing protein [Sphingobacterium sp. R2]|uniref:helix-turn-helix domain-containing protein n=1 Tax=Sphingobacterium sp. R2 TaxID=3112958 RepID=UPI00345D004B